MRGSPKYPYAAVVLVLAGLLAACGGSSAAPASPSSPATNPINAEAVSLGIPLEPVTIVANIETTTFGTVGGAKPTVEPARWVKVANFYTSTIQRLPTFTFPVDLGGGKVIDLTYQTHPRLSRHLVVFLPAGADIAKYAGSANVNGDVSGVAGYTVVANIRDNPAEVSSIPSLTFLRDAGRQEALNMGLPLNDSAAYTEACQSTVAARLDPELKTKLEGTGITSEAEAQIDERLGQEEFCNSMSAAVNSASHHVPYSQYAKVVGAFPLRGFGANIKLFVLDQAAYQQVVNMAT